MKNNVDDWLEKNLPLEVFGSSGKGLKEFSNLIQPPINQLKESSVQVVTIAGTNGKGETALRLAHLIKNSNEQKKYALWSSPHLFSVTERYQFNGAQIDSEELLDLFDKNKELASELSYYEFLFYIFCQWVCKLDLDFLILEVGLGGRLDCVNAFDADFVGLTSIGYDHTEYLGETLEEILLEKLGVCRFARPLISAVSQEELREVLKREALKKQFILEDLHSRELSPDTHFKDSNKAVATKLFSLISDQPPHQDIWSTYDDGIGRGKRVATPWGVFLAFGSHNAQGLMALEKWLEQCGENFFDGIMVGLSKRPTRDLSQCIKITFEYLKKRSNKFRIVSYQHPKAVDKRYLEETMAVDEPALYEELLRDYCELSSLWEQLEADKNPKAQYLLTGSYYFVAEFLSSLDGPALHSIE